MPKSIIAKNFSDKDLCALRHIMESTAYFYISSKQFRYYNRKRLSCSDRFIGAGCEKLVFISVDSLWALKVSLLGNFYCATRAEFDNYNQTPKAAKKYLARTKSFYEVEKFGLGISVQEYIKPVSNFRNDLISASDFICEVRRRFRLPFYDIHEYNVVIGDKGIKLVDYSC